MTADPALIVTETELADAGFVFPEAVQVARLRAALVRIARYARHQAEHSDDQAADLAHVARYAEAALRQPR